MQGHAMVGHAMSGHAMNGHAMAGHAMSGHAMAGHPAPKATPNEAEIAARASSQFACEIEFAIDVEGEARTEFAHAIGRAGLTGRRCDTKSLCFCEHRPRIAERQGWERFFLVLRPATRW